MALDVLLEAIARDADADARQVVEAARAEAERIRADADARADRHCAAAVAAREAELRGGLDARRAHALREARSEVLAERARFIDRIFMAAEATVPGTFDQPSTGAAFRRLVDEALGCFPDAPVVIRCRSGLAARLQSWHGSLGPARVMADDAVSDGVVVEAADGSARVDNTLIARLRRLRPRLSIALIEAVADPP